MRGAWSRALPKRKRQIAECSALGRKIGDDPLQLRDEDLEFLFAQTGDGAPVVIRHDGKDLREQRLALAVKRPESFVKITFNSAPA